MKREFSELDRSLMKKLKNSNLEAQDACGVFAFLDRKEEYKKQMLDFLKKEDNRNYESIMHHLAVILGHPK